MFGTKANSLEPRPWGDKPGKQKKMVSSRHHGRPVVTPMDCGDLLRAIVKGFDRSDHLTFP